MKNPILEHLKVEESIFNRAIRENKVEGLKIVDELTEDMCSDIIKDNMIKIILTTSKIPPSLLRRLSENGIVVYDNISHDRIKNALNKLEEKKNDNK